jgi:hypothetical protein
VSQRESRDQGAHPTEGPAPQLSSMPLWLGAQAYSTGVVILGSRAPEDWRRAAKRLLFALERPYFR